MAGAGSSASAAPASRVPASTHPGASPARDRDPAARVVVTGAAGYLGAAVCARLAARGVPCIGLVRAAVPASLAAVDVRAIGDLATVDAAALDAVLGGARAVVHFAGRAHVPAGSQAAAALMRDNVEAARRVAQAAARRGVAQFVLASSVKVNGERTSPGRPFRPDDPADPQDDYARSKLAGEAAVRDALAGGPTSLAVLRLPLVYGPHAPANFARLVEAVAQGRPLPLRAVHNRRSLLGLDNLADAVEAAVQAQLVGTHFVADAEAVSTPDLVRAIAAALGRPARLVAVPLALLRLAGRLAGQSAAIARLTESLEVDTSSLARASGWQPRSFRIDAAMLGGRGPRS